MTDREQLADLADMEERIAKIIDEQRPGYFLTDDPAARYAAEGARLRAMALRRMVEQC